MVSWAWAWVWAWDGRTAVLALAPDEDEEDDAAADADKMDNVDVAAAANEGCEDDEGVLREELDADEERDGCEATLR